MLLRWDPFRDLDRLSDQMWRTAAETPMRIPMDAVRTGDRVDIHFELPGIDPEAISVDVEGTTLSVTAERTESTERREGEEVLVRERRHGRFVRQVTLGEDLDTDALDASYHDGVLTVSVPVSDKGRSRRVEVTRRGDERSPIETTSQEASGDDHTHAA